MGSGITGELIKKHASGKVEGAYLSVYVDFVLLHDPAMALIIDDLASLDKDIWDKERVLVTVDHFAPPASVERANIVKKVLSFLVEKQLPNCSIYGGICHQLLVEGPWIKPGSLVVGSDSHTVTAGALGCLATGLGSTDILYTLVTGKTWLREPEAVRINLTGALPDFVMGKDLILHLLGTAGESGFSWQALEFEDRDHGLSMDDRLAVCNMVVEGGAKNGLFSPDAVTAAYLDARGENQGVPSWMNTFLPEYVANYSIDLSTLVPVLALPYSPANVIPVTEADERKIDQVFIGSCTGGRLTDIQMAAKILENRKVNADVKLLVIPASADIFKAAIDQGYIGTIMNAGGIVMNASCGPCGGIDKGILADGQTCVSTSNRNFRGRMGSPEAEIFLASPATAAATAITGTITDPRKFLT